jgi:hypothetical protein
LYSNIKAETMKRITEVLMVLLFTVATISAQDNTQYQTEGDQLKVAYFYEDSDDSESALKCELDSLAIIEDKENK